MVDIDPIPFERSQQLDMDMAGHATDLFQGTRMNLYIWGMLPGGRHIETIGEYRGSEGKFVKPSEGRTIFKAHDSDTRGKYHLKFGPFEGWSKSGDGLEKLGDYLFVTDLPIPYNRSSNFLAFLKNLTLFKASHNLP